MLEVIKKGLVLDKEGNLISPYVKLNKKEKIQMIWFMTVYFPMHQHINVWAKWINIFNKGVNNEKDYMRTFTGSYRRIK